MLDFYSNSGKVKLHTYHIDGNEVDVRDVDGKHVVKALRNPNGGQWTDVERNAWGKKTVYEYNSLIANSFYAKAIAKLEVVYQEFNSAAVTLSDGNVFSASKSMGQNPTVSLKNTIDLIRDGVEFALFSKAPSITLSDANNRDVTYEFDYDSQTPGYILPIIELAERTAIYFEIKRVLRNKINTIKATQFANIDLIAALDVDAEFRAGVQQVLEAKYPERFGDKALGEDEQEDTLPEEEYELPQQEDTLPKEEYELPQQEDTLPEDESLEDNNEEEEE